MRACKWKRDDASDTPPAKRLSRSPNVSFHGSEYLSICVCVSGLPVAFYLPFAYKKHNEARTLWQAARVQLLWCVCVVAAVVTYNFQTRVAIIWIGSASKNADTFFGLRYPAADLIS